MAFKAYREGGGRRGLIGGEKGTDEGKRERMWGRSEGRRKGKIYWWPLTLNITSTLHAPSHPPTLPPSPPGDSAVVQTLLYREWFGDGGAFQDLARYLSGLQTERSW